MTKRFIAPGAFAVGLILALSSCTNPYDPAQRAVGGGLIGAGAGAAIGGAAAGGAGARHRRGSRRRCRRRNGRRNHSAAALLSLKEAQGAGAVGPSGPTAGALVEPGSTDRRGQAGVELRNPC